MGIPQEFFAEREYVLKATSGAEYVDRLKGLLNPAATLDQDGLTPAPYGPGDVRYFFRGQADARHGLKSSLYRILQEDFSKGTAPRTIEDHMKSAETRVLKEAREQGIGRNLTSLELLTVLQHHGIPTRLIDVSASWRVALYFASEVDDSVDGRVFVIATRPSLWADFPRSHEENLEWPHSDAHPWQATTWPVILPFTDPRMISQQGYFLVGGLTTNVGGHHLYWKDTKGHTPKGHQSRASLTQQERREVSTLMIKFPKLNGVQVRPLEKLEKQLAGLWTAVGLTIPVPSNLKPQIRRALEEDGIGRDSIYPPIEESSRLLKYVAETRR